MSRTYRRYTEDQKHQAVALAAALGNTALAERQAGVGNGCIHLWRTQGYGSGGPVTTVTRVAEGHQTDQSTVPFVAAAALTAAHWETVWRDRIPAAAITVIAGTPGIGKSTLEAAIAAELSCEGLTGILSNLEDDLEAVMLPRLLAAGADTRKVLLVRPELSPKLPSELDRLERLIRDTGARFAILDPIAAHFDPERQVHSRRVLARLMSLCRETQCALIGIHHTTKVRSVTMSAMEAIGGPQGGLAGAPRAVYLYGHDPEDEDRRALACVKLNGRDRPATLITEHETVEISSRELLLDAGHLRFIEETNARPEQVLTRGKSHRDRDAECLEWLTLYLAKGDGCARQSKDLRNDGLKAGFGWATLVRAGVAIKVEKVRLGQLAGGFWVWRLPDAHPMRRAAER